MIDPFDSETETELRLMIQEEIQDFMDGFEDRLATSMRKALDTVTHGLEVRLRAVEEDVARVERHSGLDG